MKRYTLFLLLIFLAFGTLFSCTTANGAPTLKLKLKNSGKGIEISWDKLGNKKVKIQRKTSKGDFKTIKSVKGKQSFTDKSASPGKKYLYKIVCGRKISAVKKITRLKTTSIESIGYDKKGMGLVWKKIKGAKKYEVYKAVVKNNKAGKYKKIKTVKANSLDCYFEKSKTTNKYRVRAVCGNSKSAFSKPKKYNYIKRAKEGYDYSYTSKYANILNTDVPYYNYGDPLENMYYTKSCKKKAEERNKTKDNGKFRYRDFKEGVEIAHVYSENTVTIPEKINGKPVLKLGGEITGYEDGGKCYRESTWDNYAKKVVVSKNVRDIVCGTFSNMEYLKEIEVSKDNPYYSSANGILYNKDKTVLLYIPLKNPAQTISIPRTVKTIYSLFSAETKTVNVPKSVNKIKGGIENTVFDAQENGLEMMELERVNVDKDNQNYSSKDGVLYNKKKTILYLYPYNKVETKYKLPDSVKTIDYMLLDKIENLKTLTFNKKVKKIGFTSIMCYDNPLTVKVYKNTYAEKWVKSFNEMGTINIKVIK